MAQQILKSQTYILFKDGIEKEQADPPERKNNGDAELADRFADSKIRSRKVPLSKEKGSQSQPVYQQKQKLQESDFLDHQPHHIQ